MIICRKHIIGYLFLITLLFILLLINSNNFFSIDAKGASNNNTFLEENDYHYYGLCGDNSDNWTINLVVDEGFTIDFYIIQSYQLWNYHSDDQFYYTFAMENISSLNITWTQRTSHTYYIIIDNKNNSRSCDTLPEGNITYGLEYLHFLNLQRIKLGSGNNSLVISEGETVYGTLSHGWTTNTEFNIKIQVVNNTPIDLYILTNVEFEKYKYNQQFNPVLAIEDILFYDSIWKQPDDQNYIILIDNRDNQRTTDAIPSGYVTCNFESRNKTVEDRVRFEIAPFVAIFVILSAVIIFGLIGIGVVIEMMIKKVIPWFKDRWVFHHRK